MKKILSTVSIFALIAVITFGGSLSAFASPRAHRLNANTKNYTSSTSYREERTAEYEKFIDQKVADSELTKEEAAKLKEDYNSMRDYCNSFHDNSANTDYRGGGHCGGNSSRHW